jgi:hypothetical protein
MDTTIPDEAIDTFRQALSSTSGSASAIDCRAMLADISQCATEEGFHRLTILLFEVRQAGIADYREPDDIRQVTEALQQFRQYLPHHSKTAAALDRWAARAEISSRVAGMGPLLAVLGKAQEQAWHRPATVHAPVRCPRQKPRLQWSPYRWQR